ncbi:capsid assembly scaffolding protein Gp46 family protein [Levilactobacillus wangkuiensis]|uniref:capsid assembly scaffolding protein Gp46 family protein n=1 Tax=Levilactobacillus wangkuiensis TaxID=2799566 RepID=UPI00195163A1|nr:DUF4355 domain-containing protein [Levilactobacillus wangkuiensis]
MKMNLQYFADPDPKSKENDKKPKAYTQEDVNKMMAAKAKEVEKQHEDEWSKQQEELKNKYLSEGESRAQMTAEQKAAAEIEDQRKALEAQQAAADKRDVEQQRKDELNETRELLIKEGLPVSLAANLTAPKEEQRLANVKAFKDSMTGAVDAEIAKRSKGKVDPQNGSGAGGTKLGEVTKEEFDRMGVDDRMKLYRENKDLYQKLKGSN